MVRIHLYERTLEGYLIPMFKTIVVGWDEFKRLHDAKIAFKLGVQYAMISA